jgi:hypothetical protein
MLTLLGAIGIGAVWGWLLAMLGGPRRRRARRVAAVTAATALVGGQVLMLAGWQRACLFLVCAGLALAGHAMWRRTLTLRFQPGPFQGGTR